ncbi:MAG: hypothetical protein JXM70_16050 [Pirellulales bacterium]|nr:hypothetical protein [Pirellulales bacterium]
MTNMPYGFRIVGPTWERRRLVDAAGAFSGYARCDKQAEVKREGYLSAFQFGEDFRRLLTETGSTAGYAGPCWSPWLWFDIDCEELGDALTDARRLASLLDERYRLPEEALLIFFSGSKGFHVGLPTALWSPEPSDVFHQVARRFAENTAEQAGVAIDTGVYDRVRAFRAPNSRHPKTGLHKRWLSFDELMGLSLDAILDRAKQPEAFDLPDALAPKDQAVADWQMASRQVTEQIEAKAALRAGNIEGATLNRQTLNFIRDGASVGDRHRLLFSAAANLAEFGCPPALAIALLEEPSLDAGLPPKEVRRQIRCGLSSVGTIATPEDAVQSTQTTPDDESPEKLEQCNTDDSTGSEGQSCQQLTGATNPTTNELAALWNRLAPTPAPATSTLPPPFKPLPPRAVSTGKLDAPCRCGSAEYVDVELSEGRTRRDCRQCGRFLGWGEWYQERGSTDG